MINIEEGLFIIIIIFVFLMDNLLLIEKIFMSITRYNILLNMGLYVIHFEKILYSGVD